ncbi:DUF6985 domain-containing protein [Vreelandella malpeensis]|uniref:DUF6985 domain-containing protein n=1 Tax=Vreelandella malpeensis TaxID=1172368 RepID=A0ABS8DND2_9GAMM|nr:hypothetical protein [Halomonas malpeensis]MCB8887753.1 hypothetical protein [Halomonas malpeensis]
MEYVRGLQQGEDGVEGEVYSTLFDRFFPLLSEDAAPDFIKRCAAYFNALDESIIEHLCQATIHYIEVFLSETGEPIIEFATPREVLKLVTPSVLIVPTPEGAAPVAHLELECQWEPEHGMEWIVRGDRVLYVGPFNGEDPWGSFSPKAAWNFA